MYALKVSSVSGPREVPPSRPTPRSLEDVLEDLEAIERDATGVMRFAVGNHVEGVALIERGRVCWVATRGMGGRLRAVVAAASPLPDAPQRTREILRICASRSVSLREALVESGILSEIELRKVMLQHSVEALTALGAAGARPCDWSPRAAGPFGARFSFSAAELLAVSAPPALRATAAEVFTGILDPSTTGISFSFPASGAAPEPVFLTGPADLSLDEIRAIGEWARHVDPMSDRPVPAFLCTALDRGASAIAFPRRDLVHVALCVDPLSVAWVLSRVERTCVESAAGY